MYEAKDLLNFLHLKPEKIYLWLRTYRIFEPAERPKGIRGKNKYSLLDLVKLSLIANLESLGIPLDHVRRIFHEVDKADVWRDLIKNRERYISDGAILLIVRETGVDWYRLREGIGAMRPQSAPRFRVILLTNSEALRHFEERIKGPWPILTVNMKFLLDNVETASGDRLDQ